LLWYTCDHTPPSGISLLSLPIPLRASHLCVSPPLDRIPLRCEAEEPPTSQCQTIIVSKPPVSDAHRDTKTIFRHHHVHRQGAKQKRGNSATAQCEESAQLAMPQYLAPTASHWTPPNYRAKSVIRIIFAKMPNNTRQSCAGCLDIANAPLVYPEFTRRGGRRAGAERCLQTRPNAPLHRSATARLARVEPCLQRCFPSRGACILPADDNAVICQLTRDTRRQTCARSVRSL
jgi:hypothetical protein